MRLLGEESLVQQAERELLRDVTGASTASSQLIIPSIDSSSTENQSTTHGKTSTTKRKPLLLANIAPEVLAIRDEEEKFKRDLSLRPVDLGDVPLPI
jgi:hypothetical protein